LRKWQLLRRKDLKQQKKVNKKDLPAEQPADDVFRKRADDYVLIGVETKILLLLVILRKATILETFTQFFLPQ